MKNVQSFEAGSWVWVPDEKDMFLPGKVVKTFKPGEEGHIKYEDGKASCLRPAPPPRVPLLRVELCSVRVDF